MTGRSLPVLLCVVLSLGCAGTAKPAPAAPVRAGTTGLPGLDWGAPPAAVQAAYPAAIVGDGGLTLRGEHEGHAATIRFGMDRGALARIDVAFDATFPSMQDCQATFAPLRARLDARLGPSAEENLAAFWDTDTSSIILSCNMADDESAGLALYYAPRTGE